MIMNYPIPNLTSPIFNLTRKNDEIAPVKSFLNDSIKFNPGVGWTIEQYHENLAYLHEQTVVDSSVVAGSVGSGFLMSKIQRTPTELSSLGTTTTRASGDNFFQKTVAAGGAWNAFLTADESSYPPPTEPENIKVDRVYYSTANDSPDAQNWFRFFIPGSAGQTPVQLILRIYFTSMPSNRSDLNSNLPTGQYCLSLFGDASFILREKMTDGTWKLRYVNRWSKPQNVVGRWHMVGIGSDTYHNGSQFIGTTMNLRFEDLDSDLMSMDSVLPLIPSSKNGGKAVTPTNTYNFNNVNNWQPVLSKVRIDVRRDTRLKFNTYFGVYKSTGSMVCNPFTMFTFTGSTSAAVKVSCYGSFPSGTSGNIELFDANGTSCTPTGAVTQTNETLRRDFTPIAGSSIYYARITLNSATGAKTPILKRILYARDSVVVYSNPTPVTISGIGNTGVESVSISGEGRDFTTSTASLVINDVKGTYASLLDNKAGFPIKIEVDTLDANDNVISTTRVFEGRVVRAVKKIVGRRRKQGKDQTGVDDAYSARFWGKYTVYCTGMWQLLFESTLPTLSDFSEDPSSPNQPYKVGVAIEELFGKASWPTDRLEVPNYAGTGVGANRFPLSIVTASSLRIEPYSRVGNVIVDFARNYMGCFVTYDYNARKTGTVSGMFRVILPPIPNVTSGLYTRLAAFRTQNTTDPGITTAESRMPNVTNYNGGTCKQFWIQRDSMTEWVEPPEGNFVVATGTGYATAASASVLSASTGSGDVALFRALYNYPAANFGFPAGPPNNFPQPDPTHPDYIDGRQVPVLISNSSLQTQEAVDLLARRVLDNACHVKKKKAFAAPLWFVTDPNDTYQINPRPLKFGDIVTVDDVFYVVCSCSYQWSAGEGNNQMMALEVMSIPAFEAAYTGSNNQLYKTINSVTH